MKTTEKKDEEDELLPEYDLKPLLKNGIQGKYVEFYRKAYGTVRLDPDVAQAFPTDEDVNKALRMLIHWVEIEKRIRPTAARRSQKRESRQTKLMAGVRKRLKPA